MVNILYDIILQIWIMEEIPEDWSKSTICPIHKNVDLMECHNYRGISLLYISRYAEKLIGSYQCRFRKDKSTVEQIFS
jgi:hypothetical protein